MSKRTYLHRGLVRQIVGESYEPAMADFIQKLAQFGYEAISYAYKQGHAEGSAVKKPVGDGRWRHRTYNLHDSFASAVYLKGKLLKETIRYISGGELSEQKWEGKTGREWAMEYLENPRVDVSQKEIMLLCIAAVPYAAYLEAGKHFGHYEIRVISGATDYIDARWRKMYNPWFTKGKRVIKGLRAKV